MTWLKKPLPAALTLVLFWTLLRLAFLWHTGIPQPAIHDESSYLLGADTFVHGRLANPPHPLGKFFESPQVLVRPVYASKYQPGQALFLALGQRLFGSAFFGVLIGNVLMLFTCCLMLFAWVPPRWALAVTAMLALCLSPGMYWTNSYWGGSVAASGGALVLLGVGIYRARQTPLAGVIFAIGVLLLFWTRPFEGGVFTLMVLAVFARELWNKRRASVLAAALAVLALGGAWTCYYNRAITGNPFQLPYLLHDRQYNVTPVFWFLPLRPEPAYSHPRLAAQHGTGGWEAGQYKQNGRGWKRFPHGLIDSLRTLRFSLGPAVFLTILIPVAWRDPLYRKMAIVAAACLCALAVETFHQPHYDAPALPALALMIAVWAEHAWELRLRNQPVGAVLVLLSLGPSLALLPFRMSRLQQRIPSLYSDIWNPPPPNSWPGTRAALIQRLSALDRPQLVIVRYPSPDWNVILEEVYNGADIDHQRVVFAHDLGAEQNRALLNYYPDRTVSLLTFDSASGKDHIEPYPLTPSQK